MSWRKYKAKFDREREGGNVTHPGPGGGALSPLTFREGRGHMQRQTTTAPPGNRNQLACMARFWTVGIRGIPTGTSAVGFGTRTFTASCGSSLLTSGWRRDCVRAESRDRGPNEFLPRRRNPLSRRLQLCICSRRTQVLSSFCIFNFWNSILLCKLHIETNVLYAALHLSDAFNDSQSQAIRAVRDRSSAEDRKLSRQW